MTLRVCEKPPSDALNSGAPKSVARDFEEIWLNEGPTYRCFERQSPKDFAPLDDDSGGGGGDADDGSPTPPTGRVRSFVDDYLVPYRWRLVECALAVVAVCLLLLVFGAIFRKPSALRAAVPKFLAEVCLLDTPADSRNTSLGAPANAPPLHAAHESPAEHHKESKDELPPLDAARASPAEHHKEEAPDAARESPAERHTEDAPPPTINEEPGRREADMFKDAPPPMDEEALRALISDECRKLEMEKIAPPDFALSYAGASIYNHSPTRAATIGWSFLGIPLFDEQSDPELVIEKRTPEAVPGVCCLFNGRQGFVTIELSSRIVVSAVAYEHAPSNSLTEEALRSVPREIEIWAGLDPDDMRLAGRFTFTIPPKGEVLFQLPTEIEARYVQFRVLENYGGDYTSLYRVRVYRSSSK